MTSISPLRVLALIFSLLTVLAPSAVWAQAERAYSNPGNRVVSLDEDYGRNALVIRMERSTPAAPPVFKYMPGINGDTVLTADFVGLAWNSPPRIIRLISSEKGLRPSSYAGIKEVRVSQFVESPAVLRISFVARDPKLLKSVAIASGPGVLKVSWPTPVARSEPVPSLAPKISKNPADSEPEIAPQTAPQPAPKAIAKAVPKAVVEAPKIAALTSDEKSSHSKLRLPRIKSPDTGVSSSTAAGGTGQAATTEAPQQAAAGDESPVPDATDDPVPTISLVPCDSLGTATKMEVFRVEVPQGNEISFKAFRLHDPERYVIDIPGCRSIINSDLPDITASSLVSSLRVGVPNEGDGVGRLVLQLTDNQVNVADSYTPGSNFFTVTLGKGLMMSSEGHATATTERFSSPDLVPGPIIVPRAPSETVIVLDAGHGGTDAGAVRADIQEKDITLAIIQKLKKVLEAKGARIVLTRHDDTFVSLEDRVRITNQVGPNLFLSVHINSLEGTSNAYGIETYFQTELSRPLAERVHASLVAGLQTPDRNIRRARFYVINHTPVPAILAEVGYITNKTERDRLISSDWQQKIAGSLARGVMLYLQDSGAAGQLANSGSSRGAH